jgi:hypothetical protein
MLNRSKVIIDVDSFIRSDIPHSSDAAEPHAVPKSRLDDRVKLSAANVDHAPRRTAPFPNGDLRRILAG